MAYLIHTPYTLHKLTYGDLESVVALQDTVYKNLSSTQKNFILLKSIYDLDNQMHNHGQMIGAFHKGALIACGAVAFAHEGSPTGAMIINESSLPCSYKELAILQTSMVLSTYRGLGIHAELIKAREEIAKNVGKTHLMSEVAVENPASLKGALKNGGQVIMSAIDPSDGCKLFYTYKNIYAEQKVKPESSFCVDPIAHFEKATLLLEMGYKGVSIRPKDKSSYVLHLHAPAI